MTPATPSAPSPQTTRLEWIDAARGIGIILVVFGHVLRGLDHAPFARGPLFSFIDSWIYAFHMPLFFFLSGLFLFRAREKPFVGFVSDKIRTLAYPYFLWSTMTLLIKSSGLPTNQAYSIHDLPRLLYHPIDQYWFLFVLFFLSVGVQGLLRVQVRPATIVVIAAMGYVVAFAAPMGALAPVLLEMRFAAIFVALGVLAESRQATRWLTEGSSGWLVVACAAGLAVASLGGVSKELRAVVPVLAVSGIVGVIALSVLMVRMRVAGVVQSLGRRSMEIYLAHTMASAGTRILLFNGLGIAAFAPHLVLGVLNGLVLPVQLAKWLERRGLSGAAFPARSPLRSVRGRREERRPPERHQ